MGKRQGRSSNTGRYHYASNEAQKFLEMKQSGQLGEFICGVSDWSPEYDRFDLEKGTLEMRGWRSLLTYLAKRDLISLDEAKRVFRQNSLGESSYDKMRFEQKLALAKAEVTNAK